MSILKKQTEIEKRQTEDKKSGNLLCENMNFASSEAFKKLRSNLMFSFPGDGLSKVICVTSPDPVNGKSMVAINLAYSFAELNKKVLLIDADMRLASIHTKLDLDIAPGLSNALSRNKSEGKLAKKYSGGGVEFSVMTAGDSCPNPMELLASENMKNLLNSLKELFDYVIIDTPPIGAVGDAQVISKLTDGTVLVVRSGKCSKGRLLSCIRELKLAEVKILGFVLNGAGNVKSKNSSYSGGYYYYSN